VPDDSLNKFRSTILFLLWRRRRNSDGSRVLGKDLLTELLAGKFAGVSEKSDLRALKKALRRLEKAGFVESGPVSKEDDSQPGPPPNGFRLPEEGKMITWQSTSTLVIRLFNHPHEPVEEEFFVLEMLQVGLHRDDTGHPMTKADILNQIAYCERKGYLTISESDDQLGGRNVRRLHRTQRIDKERHLLEMIADVVNKKRATSATEPDSSSTVSDRDDSMADGSPR
jgi:hypothetical protein